LDLGQVLPIYEPSEYPATAALIEGGFISDQSPVVGALQSNAWPNDVAFNTPEIMEEWDAHGLVPLVPVYNSGSNGLFCSQERNDLSSISGTAVGSGGT
ncbi:C4-dicarboxylate ABC transporter substrate-binding protein, partial [Aeromicrobium phragmitis]